MISSSVRFGFAAAVVAAAIAPPAAQSVREHTRLKGDRSTVVSDAQASELTLTVTAVSVRPIQAWVRAAGSIDAAYSTITAVLPAADAALVRTGQRARVFATIARSTMYQGRVTRLVASADRVTATIAIAGQVRHDAEHFVVEIVADHGELLSIANEAIIETGGTRIVYVQLPGGRYEPRQVDIGVQGELYTQVVGGVLAGEQVVTLGSFFVDAERKLKGL